MPHRGTPAPASSRLLKKVVAFIEVHSTSASDKRRLERWSGIHQDMLGYARQLGFDEIDEELEEDFIPEEMLAAVEVLNPDEFDIPEMLTEAFFGSRSTCSIPRRNTKIRR